MKLPPEIIDEISKYLPFEKALLISQTVANKKYKEWFHTLKWAIYNDDIISLEWLLKYKKQTLKREHVIFCIKSNSLKCLKLLLNVSKDNLIFDKNDKTILKNAAAKNVGIYKELVSFGFKKDDKEILNVVIENDNVDVFKALCFRDMDIDYDELLSKNSIKIFSYLFSNSDKKIQVSIRYKPLFNHGILKKYFNIYGYDLFYDSNDNIIYVNSISSVNISGDLRVSGHLYIDGDVRYV